jgi:uncharacterized membrane protein YeaQ/YmgE (transglycosylase-associated protein family)
MNLILQLIVGGVIGWLASMVMKTNAQMGLIANVLVGVVGAGLGGWIAGKLGVGGGPVLSWVMAIVGASLLIALLKMVGLFK